MGVLRLELTIPGAQTLKERRAGVAQARDRLRAQDFAVGEVGYLGHPGRAVLAVTAVGSDPAVLRAALERVPGQVEGYGRVMVVGRALEVQRWFNP